MGGSSSNALLEDGDEDSDDMMEDNLNMTLSTGRVNNNQTIIIGNQY